MSDIQYKLYKKVIPDCFISGTEKVMYNRGITNIQDQKKWLNAGWESIYDWKSLAPEKMKRACEILRNHIKQGHDVQINVDCDGDGYTSAAIIYNYLFQKFPSWTKAHLSWIHHKGKEHGLSDIMQEINSSLIICPDSSTNDIAQQKILHDNNIDCIILDHHLGEGEVNQSYATIINVQLEDYPNKSLTGAGVAYKFICAFEDLYGKGNSPTKFMDLCAVGNGADMADYRQPEIRAIINIGFSNINNPFIYELCQKHEYTLNKRGGINYLSMAFACFPFINAICRTGNMEDKDMVFRAMLNHFAFDEVPSSKRGDNGKLVYRYREAVTIAERVKRNQDKLAQESMELFDKKIQDQHLDNNAIIIITCEPDEVEGSVAGLTANKLQAKYQHPCLVLRRSRNINDEEDFYRGSGRNYSHCPIENFKDMCEKTGLTEFQAGHQGAFGLGLAASKIDAFTDATNDLYKEIDFTPVYWVDFIWQANQLNKSVILEIADLTIWGQEMPESLIAVEDIPLSEAKIDLLSPDKHPTLKINYNDVEYIKFGYSQEEYEELLEQDGYMTIVGVPSKNEWNGKVTPQIQIADYNIEEKWVF